MDSDEPPIQTETRVIMTPEIHNFMSKVLTDGNLPRPLRSRIRIGLIKPETEEHLNNVPPEESLERPSSPEVLTTQEDEEESVPFVKEEPETELRQRKGVAVTKELAGSKDNDSTTVTALTTPKKSLKEGFEEDSDPSHTMACDVIRDAHDFYTSFISSPSEPFVHLDDLLSGAFTVQLPPVKRSKELEERLKLLQKEENQRTYDKMVGNVNHKKAWTSAQEAGQAVRSTSKQFMTILNFVLSVGGTAAFMFVAGQWAFQHNLGARIILAMVSAVIVALAELYFMAKWEI